MLKKKEPLYFLIYLAGAYISWRVLMWILGEQATPLEDRLFPTVSAYWEAFNQLMSGVLANLSKVFLEALGYTAEIEPRKIGILDSSGVFIGNYCLGLEMMYLYAVLILLTPIGHWPRKIAFLIFGLILIQFANVVRMSLLAILIVKDPLWADFNHYFTFRVLVFGLILLLFKWMLSGARKQTAKENMDREA